MSGGVDSAVTYGLCHRAMRKEGSPIQRVVGVAQPICSTASVWQRALELKEAFNGEIITVDQTEIHKQLFGLVEKEVRSKIQEILELLKMTTVDWYRGRYLCSWSAAFISANPCGIFRCTASFPREASLCCHGNRKLR